MHAHEKRRLTWTGCAHRLGNNLAGHYKRGVGMALHIGIGNFGGAIASNIYRSQDAPRYILGRAYTLLSSSSFPPPSSPKSPSFMEH